MKVILYFITFMLLSCCACNKTAGLSPIGCPDLHGVFATLEKEGESGRSDMFLDNSSVRMNVSSTWAIDSPSYLSFSTDGRTLLFEGREGYVWNIYLYDVTTGEVPVCLTRNIGADCRHPRFAPDGKSIVFSQNGQIAMMDLSTGKSSFLTFGAVAENDYPVVSPDGKFVIYTGGRDLQKLEMASLSSSSIKVNCSSKVRSPFFAAGHCVYLDGNKLCEDGRVLFLTDGNAAPAFGEWITFSRDGKACIGNVSTKESYEIRKFNGSECIFAPVSVEIAVPEDGGRVDSPSDDIVSDTALPPLKGRLVFHSYTSYDAMDSKMYIYDFALDRLTEISRDWTVVRHPMNGHFSSDGRFITFMGIGASGSWDIFLYELGSSGQPQNLTPDGSYRDEDPKFSYSGEKICFKRNDRLAEIRVSDKSLTILSEDNGEPFSMPYYTTDDSGLLFGGGHNPHSYIGLWDIAGGTWKKLYDKANTVEYYPVTIDSESFYFTRHVSSTDTHDQLYKGYFDGSAPEYLAFNKTNADYSDACTVSSGWLILVSTRPGSAGGYDMYIAHEKSGAIYSLSEYNPSLNSKKNELGADYIPSL